MVTFGQELKRLAESKGLLTQQDLAKASGVSQTMVSALYKDAKPNVSAVIVYKLCSALGVPFDHFRPFFAEEEPPASPPEPEKKRKKGKK